jgi:hypothetical protein
MKGTWDKFRDLFTHFSISQESCETAGFYVNCIRTIKIQCFKLVQLSLSFCALTLDTGGLCFAVLIDLWSSVFLRVQSPIGIDDN